jgi:hypothetical protein
MKRNAAVAALILTTLLAACQKRDKTAEEQAAAAAPVPAPASVPAPVPAAAPAEQTPEQRDMEKKQALLAFGVMEDKFLNDTRGQWATDAKASTTYGDSNGQTPSKSNLAQNAVGAPDGERWSNANTEKGFDWIELGFAKPVNATEVRVVLPHGQGVEAINKLELQDVDGKWVTVWEGLHNEQADKRGDRTWFIRTFEKTTYKAKGARVTYANNLHHDYKVVDAVQLVGDQ